MTVYAFTELHNAYPAFVNLSEQPDGTLKLSVRTRGNGGTEYASIVLTDTQAEELAEPIFKHVYAADAPTVAAPLPAAPAHHPICEQKGYNPLCPACEVPPLRAEQAVELPPLPDGKFYDTPAGPEIRFTSKQLLAFRAEGIRASLAARQAPTDAPKDTHTESQQ